MCIIVLKPKHRKMPSLEIMENCFSANPDGSGFMYRDDGKIHIVKGFMSLADLLDAINLVNDTIDLRATDVCLHFRITTHGSSTPANCHPFPLSNDIQDLKALSIITDRAIAHNGILHDYGKMTNASSDMSDTMYFAKMLSGVNDRFISNVISAHSHGSKFVLMTGKKTLSFGMKKYKGLWYSNDSYKPYIAPKVAYISTMWDTWNKYDQSTLSSIVSDTKLSDMDRDGFMDYLKNKNYPYRDY